VSKKRKKMREIKVDDPVYKAMRSDSRFRKRVIPNKTVYNRKALGPPRASSFPGSAMTSSMFSTGMPLTSIIPR
jgi:hypothetical protein